MPRPDKKKSLVGVVSSDKMNKTVTVQVEHSILHPRLHKYIKRQTKLHAHDEANDARTGDTVRIVPSRPLSKSKSWRMVEIVRRGPEPI